VSTLAIAHHTFVSHSTPGQVSWAAAGDETVHRAPPCTIQSIIYIDLADRDPYFNDC
jgi:hypothetical protein